MRVAESTLGSGATAAVGEGPAPTAVAFVTAAIGTTARAVEGVAEPPRRAPGSSCLKAKCPE